MMRFITGALALALSLACAQAQTMPPPTGAALGMSGTGSTKQLKVQPAPGQDYVPVFDVDAVAKTARIRPEALTGVAPTLSAVAVHVPSLAALKALAVPVVGAVLQDGYSVAGDGGAAGPFRWRQAPCSAPDNVSQVTASAGGCFVLDRADLDRNCFDPRRMGVKWDGVTNDSIAFQAALNAAVATASTKAACLLMPAGTGILGNITIPPTIFGLTIKGISQGATKVMLQDAGATLFKQPSIGSGTHTRDLEISDFTVVPAGTTYDYGNPDPNQQVHYGTPTGGITFDLDQTENLSLHDVTQIGGWSFLRAGGINGYGLISAHIHNNRTRGFKWTVYEFDSGNDLQFADNAYDGLPGCQRNPSVPGDTDNGDYNPTCQPPSFFLDRNFSGVILYGINDAIHCGTCFLFEPLAGQQINWLFIMGMQADTSAGDGIYFHAEAGGMIRGVHLVQPWASANYGRGMIFGTDAAGGGQPAGKILDVNVLQPLIRDNRHEGILLQGFNDRMSIVDAAVVGNGQLAPGTLDALHVISGYGRISLTGGSIGSNYADWGMSTKFSLNIESGWTGNITGANVNLEGSATGAVNDGGSGITMFDRSPGVNIPAAPTVTTPTTSPFTVTNYLREVSYSLYGGTVSSVTVAGVQVCNASPCSFKSSDKQAVVITFSSAPTLVTF